WARGGRPVAKRVARNRKEPADQRAFLHDLIVDSLKLSIREFLDWFEINHPDEHLYGLLVDVPSEGAAASIVAATEEPLERAVKKVRRRSESPDAVRDALRWSAPGESGDPWFWPQYRWVNAATHVIQLGIGRGLVPRYDATVKDLAVRALEELERDGAFGAGAGRERLYVGVLDIHDDFEDWVERSSGCNPAAVTRRVRVELARAERS